MMNNYTKQAIKGVSLMSVFMLSACSTAGTVSGALGSLNPFSKSDGGAALEAAEGDPDRISILQLSEDLTIVGTVTPDQIVLPPAYVNTDWPQQGGNTAHVVQHTAASGDLSKIWSKDIGEGSGKKGRVLSPPVIANGKIYSIDGSNRVVALDENSGKKLWTYKVKADERQRTREGRAGLLERAKDPLSFFAASKGVDKESVGGGVTYANGKVYVTSGLGKIVAIDAETGEEIWGTQILSPLHSAPVAGLDRVFAISDDNVIYAFDTTDGEIVWSHQAIIESARMLTVPSPALVDDVLVAPFSSGELIALRQQNGNVLWQDSLSSRAKLTPLASLNDISAGPAIADGFVIATAQSGVMTAFDLRTGQRVWSQPAGALGYPLIAGDFVFTVTTRGEVACLSKIDGSVIWIKELELYKKTKKRKGRIVWSGPILAGERLVVVSSHGLLVTINPFTGDIIDESKVGDGVFISPIIANETVYVLSDKAKLTALR
ncbi:MAG: PQQ-binding-like beta-propeller repeat protein [Litorimonas sp.]